MRVQMFFTRKKISSQRPVDSHIYSNTIKLPK